MRIILVSMPWADFSLPSAAIGALSAYVRREIPRAEVVCRSEHAKLAQRVGLPLYERLATQPAIGRMLYLAQAYPERISAIRSWFAGRAAKDLALRPGDAGHPAARWEEAFDQLHETLEEHLEELAAAIARDADLVGLTTSLGQLFASIALARRVGERRPDARVLLGGAGLRWPTATSLLREYACIDAIVLGNGELPLAAVIRSLETSGELPLDAPGLVTRLTTEPPRSWECPALDDLPIPDFHEYAALAEECGILWSIPIEASRGCWWDRSRRKGDPGARCLFCNYSSCSYQRKSAARIAAEMAAQADAHRNVRFVFCDNVAPLADLPRVTEAIAAREKEFSFCITLRANHRPHHVLRLRQAGMYSCMCGIEGLSSGYLRRLNKGTSVIQNLEMLKSCTELGLPTATNLITDFPAATPAEVDETVRNIDSYACAYSPVPSSTSFVLADGSAVAASPNGFGITDVRNHDEYGVGLPPAVFQRIRTPELSWTAAAPAADWSPVLDALRRWAALHDRTSRDPAHTCPHPLYYLDGGTFLEVIDRREGCRSLTFAEPWRSVYLFCMEIRTDEEIAARFGAGGAEAERALSAFLEHAIMFREGRRYLSLAVAPLPHLAERRIAKACRERADAREGAASGWIGRDEQPEIEQRPEQVRGHHDPRPLGDLRDDLRRGPAVE